MKDSKKKPAHYLMKQMNRLEYERVNHEYPFLTKVPQNGWLIGPDTDGIISGIYATEYLGGKIVGTYDGSALTLKNGLSIENGEYTMLDCELFTEYSIKSIGNHCLSLDKIGRDTTIAESALRNILHEKSVFNPGIYRYKIHDSKQRYPFGTCHFIVQNLYKCGFGVNAVNVGDKTAIPFLHADGCFSTMSKYWENAENWMRYLNFEDGPFKDMLNSSTPAFMLKEMSKFWEKRDGLCWKTNRDGDDITYVNDKGELIDDGRMIKLDNGAYSASKEYKEKRIGYIRLICEYLHFTFKEEKFDIFDDFNITTFKRVNYKNNVKNIREVYEGVSDKTILSYNGYSGDSICCTKNNISPNSKLLTNSLFKDCV